MTHYDDDDDEYYQDPSGCRDPENQEDEAYNNIINISSIWDFTGSYPQIKFDIFWWSLFSKEVDILWVDMCKVEVDVV